MMQKSQRVVVLILFALVLATLAPAFCRQQSGFKDGFAGGGFGGGGGSTFLASAGSNARSFGIADILEWLAEQAGGFIFTNEKGSYNGQGPAGGGGGGGFPQNPQACRPEDNGCGNSDHGGGGGF